MFSAPNFIKICIFAPENQRIKEYGQLFEKKYRSGAAALGEIRRAKTIVAERCKTGGEDDCGETVGDVFRQLGRDRFQRAARHALFV